MSRPANPARGETAIVVAGERLVIRPSFAALVAAEEELGSLFGLAERAGAGEMRIAEIAALFWHCLAEPPEGCTRAAVGEAVASLGLARIAPLLKVLLMQILQGRV